MHDFHCVVMLLIWLILLVLNLWVFQKSKAQGNLLMAVGGAVMGLVYFVFLVSRFPSEFVQLWLPMIGMLIFAAGFFLSVRPMVQSQLDSLKQKLHDVTASKPAPEGDAAPGGDAAPEDEPKDE